MKILKQLDLNDIIFIDIESVRIVDQLQPNTPLWDSWEYKMKRENNAEPLEAFFADRAALYAEFAKIVCITIGKIKDGVLKLKSYYEFDEAVLLQNFCKDITNITANNRKTILCGHAVKGFDIPFIMRRCIVNQIEIPSLFDVADIKPWNLNVIDMLDLWKGTGFSSASLINISTALGLPNPKDDIQGYETSGVYYGSPEGLQRIATYCERDVLSVANIVRKCRYEPIVTAESSVIEVKPVGLLERIYNTGEVNKADEKELMKKLKKLAPEEKLIADDILTVAKTKRQK